MIIWLAAAFAADYVAGDAGVIFVGSLFGAFVLLGAAAVLQGDRP